MTAKLGEPGVYQGPPPTLEPTPPNKRDFVEANDHQVGGDHYIRLTPNPWDVIMDWDLNFLAGNVLKYLVRYRSKDGIQSLLKAKHYLEKLIEYEVKKAGNTGA